MTGVRARRSRRAKRPNTTRPGKKRKKNHKVIISDEVVKKNWDKSKTLKENFKGLGLAYNSNDAVNSTKQKDDTAKMDTDNGDTQTATVEELEQKASNAKKTERHISTGEADFLTGLLNDHGEDYKAMARDKRNIYQHTPKQLKRKCEAYMRSSYFEKYQKEMEVDEEL